MSDATSSLSVGAAFPPQGVSAQVLFELKEISQRLAQRNQVEQQKLACLQRIEQAIRRVR